MCDNRLSLDFCFETAWIYVIFRHTPAEPHIVLPALCLIYLQMYFMSYYKNSETAQYTRSPAITKFVIFAYFEKRSLNTEPNCVFRQIFEQYLREKSILPDRTIELWSIQTIKQLVQNDVGITYLPRFAVERELMQGTLAEIPTELSDTTITAVCGYHKKQMGKSAYEAVFGTLQNNA